MAKSQSTKLDLTGWDVALDAIAGPVADSLAARMAVEAGVTLRDEAKLRALQSHARTDWVTNESSRGSQAPGTLSDAIYLAKNEKLTHDKVVVYSVSWNAKKAFWGKFVEFGYLMRYVTFKDIKGVYHTIKSKPLKSPRPIAAHPFLATAFDAKIGTLGALMIARGKKELPILLAEHTHA